MINRELFGKNICSLGMGTSTLVNGHLCQGLNDEERISVLTTQIKTCVNVLHSNAKLGTQWAVKKAVVDSGVEVNHLIKTEASLSAVLSGKDEDVMWRVKESIHNLSTSDFMAIVCELDHKQTDMSVLTKKDMIKWYSISSEILNTKTSNHYKIIAMCKSEIEYDAAIESNCVDCIGGYLNMKQSGLFSKLDIIAHENKPVVAFAPFNRGGMFDETMLSDNIKQGIRVLIANGKYETIAELSIKAALAHPNVRTVIARTNNVDHFDKIWSWANDDVDWTNLRQELLSVTDFGLRWK